MLDAGGELYYLNPNHESAAAALRSSGNRSDHGMVASSLVFSGHRSKTHSLPPREAASPRAVPIPRREWSITLAPVTTYNFRKKYGHPRLECGRWLRYDL